MKLFCSALCGIFLLLRYDCAEGVFQPECDSLDTAINNIHQSLEQMRVLQGLDSATINCTKKPDCDGFTCILGFQSQKTEITVELKPCEEPPQMFILMRDVDGTEPFVEQTVSHGDSIPIPGLRYRYQFLRMQSALGVQIENVSNGLRIGLSLDFYSAGMKFFSVPLLPPTVISVPDCTSTDVDDQCTHMQTLVGTLHPPHDFQCFKNPDCKGFNCTGVIPAFPGVNIGVAAKLVIDSCTHPVSYEISVGPQNGPPSDTRVFSHSENIQLVLGSLPPGFTADLNVTMIPYSQDIDYIKTTIEVLLCYPGTDCIQDIFIDNAPVPIPPCDNPVPPPTSARNVTTTPLPGSTDECTTMTDIAEDIQNNRFLQSGSMICHRNGPCDGIECTINSRPNNLYTISMKLFHCEDPVRIHVVIEGVGSNTFHEDHDVFHDETIGIDEILNNSSLKFNLVKRDSNEVELAVLLKLSLPNEQAVYLIKDRIIPVADCLTTKKTNKIPKDPSNNKKDPRENQQSNSVSIGFGVGIAVLIAVIVIILVSVWYHRRNRPSFDSVALMESSSAPI